MKTYDWIVIGGGLAGSALSYELQKSGLSVLLLEKDADPLSATRFSYGGIAYWSGTTPLTQQLCQEGINLHRTLSAELETDIQFRELDLVMPIAPGRDADSVAAMYANCLIPPTLISTETACEIEPLLVPEAIAAALHVRHGHVDPEKAVQAYQQAFLRLGGVSQIGQVTGLVKTGNQVTGVITPQEIYNAGNIVVAAGGLSRALLRSANIPVRLYYTQAELIETPPVSIELRALVMPAELKRFPIEAEAGKAETDALWDQPGHEVAPPILDAGVVQLSDRRLRIGQISRTLTDPNAQVDAAQSEAEMRSSIAEWIPDLKDVCGQWQTCLVAFSGDRLPLVGALPNTEGLHIFSGFSNPFALLPPLARRFAQSATGQPDEILRQVAADRFIQTVST